MKAMNLLNIVTWPLIWHLKRRGVMSFAWVCNSRESFDRAVRGGFQGIMTDDPILLDQYLKEKCLRVVD
jgi:glycerophosphoryl diester phosphodiesterase